MIYKPKVVKKVEGVGRYFLFRHKTYRIATSGKTE